MKYLVCEGYTDNGSLDCHPIIAMDNGKRVGCVEDIESRERERDANVMQLSLIAALFGHEDTIGGESLVDYLSRMVGNLRNENADLRDALRVRIDTDEGQVCPECHQQLRNWQHAPTCRHYATEREVMQ